MAALKTSLLITIVISITICHGARKIVNYPDVGGLFNKNTLFKSQEAFEKVSSRMHSFIGHLMYLHVTDTYSTSLEVCQNTTELNGIVALIDGRPTEGSCDIVCLLCNKLQIPHLAIGWEPLSAPEDSFSFSYYPPPSTVSEAFVSLIKDLDWDRFSILYEDESSFIRLQEIIDTWPYTKEPITMRKLVPGGDNREIFKYIFKTAKLSHHIIDCAEDNIVYYVKEILQVENSTEYQSFILTNLDSHTANLSDLHDIMANISTVHMTLNDFTGWNSYGIETESAKMEAALAADALIHLNTALAQLKTVNLQKAPALCLASELSDWSLGQDIRDVLMQTAIKGFTGNIEFDENRKRKNFVLHYAKLNTEGKFITYGTWESTTKTIKTLEHDDSNEYGKLKENIRVVSQRAEPYLFIDIINNTVVPRGYAVDLAREIFSIINQKPGNNYKLHFDEVSGYGTQMEGTKKWSGIIGELMEHKADLAIGDLSITQERNSVVDFSTPFMSTGISMLFKERDPEEPDMFSFINPLALDVWLYLMTTYIIVSFVLLICARMSQDDWVNPHPCNQNPENLQNIWSLYNCMWLTMGSIMTQGCDILPRGLGSRWTTGFWYFFAMIVTASYTANMSTFLSNSRRINDIANAKELSEQTKISYGAVTNASTYKFFKYSNDTVYSKIWQVMNTARPTVFTKNNKEGKDRVLNGKGNYAFFMEATAIKYYTERDCRLRMVGPTLNSNNYGIAMPKHFRLKGEVDQAILKLQESGKLTELKEKWWKIEDNPTPCEPIQVADDSGSLQMKNTSGIFLVLGVGAVLGLIVAVIEFLLHARKIGVKEKVPFMEALKSEWRASLDPRVLAKPADPLTSAPTTRTPSPIRERSTSRAVSVLRAATSFINFDEIY